MVMKRVIREIVEAIILTIIIYTLIHAVIETKRVEGSSMEPTLQTGNHLVLNKAVYWRFDPRIIDQFIPGRQNNGDKPFYIFGQPQRGDIIVLKYPRDTTRDFIKRIIALPGDTVEIKQGRVYVNNQPLNEPYILARPAYYLPREVVPPDNVFVLGDNRNNSSDSHIWGMLPINDIVGKAWIMYWPPSKWGPAPNAELTVQQARQLPANNLNPTVGRRRRGD